MEELNETLKKDLIILKKNHELLSKEDLNGKYSKSYQALKNRIRKEASLYVKESVFGYLLTDATQTKKLLPKYNLIAEKMSHPVSLCLFKYQDFDLLELVLNDARRLVVSEYLQVV